MWFYMNIKEIFNEATLSARKSKAYKWRYGFLYLILTGKRMVSKQTEKRNFFFRKKVRVDINGIQNWKSTDETNETKVLLFRKINKIDKV